MPVQISCPNPDCKKSCKVPDNLLYSPMSCPHCKTRFIAASSSQNLPPPQADRRTRIGTPGETADGIQPRAAKQGQANRLPARIGRFQIRALRGAGAFGTVYRAYDPQLDREVALKVPLAGVLDSPLRVERFLREARAAAQLRHPHIVPVHEAGHDGEQYYIASAFIEGHTLAEVCSEGPLEPRRAAQIVRDLAEALAYAHDQGIVHRDVKPANVMIDSKGRPHLMDFGLAARQDSEEKLTVDGAILGTAAYMAPEHASGRQGDPKAASDQYSLGVVLYELLCGRTPFAGPPAVMLFNAVHSEPPAPRSIRPDLPRDLETICLTALAKKPADRFEDCQEFADDLRRWLEDEPIHARSVSRVEKAVKWMRRNPAIATLLALIVLVTLLGVAGIYWKYRDAEDQRAIADEQRGIAENKAAQEASASAEVKREQEKTQQLLEQVTAEKKNAEKALTKSEWLVYAGNIGRAQEALNEGRVADARVFLDDCRRDFRGWEHNYLFNKNQRTFRGHTGSVYCVAWSPDGKYIVSGGGSSRGPIESGELKVWDAETGQETFKIKGYTGGIVNCVAWSPDGKRIVSGNWGGTIEPGEIKVWDAVTGKETVQLQRNTGSITSLTWSPDGKWIVSGRLFGGPSNPGKLNVWDAATGQETSAFQENSESVTSVAWSPDGKWIVSACMDKTLKVWDAATGQQKTLIFKGHMDDIRSVAWSPDGKYIVSGSGDHTLKVWDAATGQDTLTLRGHSRAVQSVAWSGDGKRIVSASWDNTLMVWDAITGQDTLTLKEPKAPVRSVAWSRDGKRIVSGSDDKTLTMWEAITDEETISLTEHTRTPSESAAGVRRTYRLRTETMLQAGEYAEAAKRAILFHETNPSNFLDTFVAARFLARCVPLAQDDAKLSEEQRAKLADAYGTQAVQLLDKAINMANDYKSRLKNIHDLMNAPDLEPLRKRKDFQKQLADVEKKEKSDSK